MVKHGHTQIQKCENGRNPRSRNVSPCKNQSAYKLSAVCRTPVMVEPPNKGHVGAGINSADVFFVGRCSFLGGSKCTVGIMLRL